VFCGAGFDVAVDDVMNVLARISDAFAGEIFKRECACRSLHNSEQLVAMWHRKAQRGIFQIFRSAGPK